MIIGNITGHTGTSAKGNIEKQTVYETEYKKRLDELTAEVDQIDKILEAYKANIETGNITADDGHIEELFSISAVLDIIKSKRIDTDELESKNIDSTNIIAKTVNSELVIAERIRGQILDLQEILKANSFTANTINSNKIEATEVKTNSLETTELSLSHLTASNIGGTILRVYNAIIEELNAQVAEIKELNADDISSKNIVSELAKVLEFEADIIRTKKVESKNIESEQVNSPLLSGVNYKTLAPLQTLTDETDEFYHLKILKGFSDFELYIPGSFDIRLVQSFCGKAYVTRQATIALLHQYDLKQVLRFSEDDDYVYIDINPDGSHSGVELQYKVTAKDSEYYTKNFFDYTPNELPSYDYFYKPMKTSEVIMLGSGLPENENYQMTVLGKLYCTMSPDFADTKFDSIHIAHDIHTKDYYNEASGSWEYKKGTDNQYLTTVNEEYDEETEKWITRICWKTPVDNETITSLELTEDSTEYVYDEEGQVIGERNVYGTKHRLVTANTVANWNGKVEAPGEEEVEEEYDISGTYPGYNFLYWLQDKELVSKTPVEGEQIFAFLKDALFNDVVVKVGDPILVDPGEITYEDKVLPRYGRVVYKKDTSESYNPITKLGNVDEGNWEYEAGYIHTEELGIHNDITWKTNTELEAKEYSVWLDGELPTEDDVKDWIRR